MKEFLQRFVPWCIHVEETWPTRLPDETRPGRTCLNCGRRRMLTEWPPQLEAPRVSIGYRPLNLAREKQLKPRKRRESALERELKRIVRKD